MAEENNAGSRTHRELTIGGKEEVDEASADSMSALQAELAALKKENEKLNMMAEIEKLKKDNEELAQAAEAAKEDNPEEDTLEEDFSAFKSPGGLLYKIPGVAFVPTPHGILC